MKIPGLFGKAPKYHRFEYKPRYYNPKEEENRERENRIRAEIARENGTVQENNNEAAYDYRTRIKGSFQTARKRSAPVKSEPNSAVLRLAILLFLVLLVIGFLEWGGKVLYLLFLIFPVWIYLKFFAKNKEG